MNQFSLKLSDCRATSRLALSGMTVAICICLLNSASAYGTEQPSEEELKAKHLAYERAPSDTQASYAYAECLRNAGRLKEAAAQYLKITSLEPTFYVAYHQLCSSSPAPDQLDEALKRLTELKTKHPQELMLVVALSEVLEKQSNYYSAARSLIDLVYQNTIPAKYIERVNTRIHFLLSKAKDVEAAQNAKDLVDYDDELMPPALPESNLKSNLAASKIKEPKVMRGFGHAPLLP